MRYERQRRRKGKTKKGENTRMVSSDGESISCGPIPKRKRSSANKRCSVSSIDAKSKFCWTDGSEARDARRYRRLQSFKHVEFQWTPHKKNPRSASFVFARKAMNRYNRTSSKKYKLLDLCNVTPVLLPLAGLFHINFMAKNTEDPHAPEEMFFTEVINHSTRGVNVRLCVSLGPINSVPGDKMNGCYYCRRHNNCFHPKGGGFSRGGDSSYKKVQDICDINQNNAIPDHEKHLPIHEQVSRSCEPKKEQEYISEQFDDASLYATEALKFYNQRMHTNFELLEPGIGTRVILPTCLLIHVNFKAKDTNVATAPEEIFFAELTSTSEGFSFKLCKILSPVTLISGDKTGDKTNGCYYCHEFKKVRHPNYGYVRGGDSIYLSDKEFYC